LYCVVQCLARSTVSGRVSTRRAATTRSFSLPRRSTVACVSDGASRTTTTSAAPLMCSTTWRHAVPLDVTASCRSPPRSCSRCTRAARTSWPTWTPATSASQVCKCRDQVDHSVFVCKRQEDKNEQQSRTLVQATKSIERRENSTANISATRSTERQTMSVGLQ